MDSMNTSLRLNFFRKLQIFIERAEYKSVFVLLVFLSLYLVALILRQSPFNSFEDDASWLLPSLAYDMSSLSWSDQLSRDVGERGAISLNMMLRLLYLIFDSWPVGYRLFGIFAHTICTFLMYVAMRTCGTNRKISLWVSICFFFCSLQFHAMFWIIGVQHILAVSSILATCIIANYIFRRIFCQYRSLNAWHSGLALALLLMIGANRVSVLISLIAFSIFFAYYAIKMGGILNREKRLFSSLRLYGFYIFGMFVISVFSFYQLSRQGEGWQIAGAIKSFGIPNSIMIYLQNISILFACLTLLLSVICILIFFISRYASLLVRKHFTNLCYFLGVLGIVLSILILDKNLYVIPALLENLIFIPDISALVQRWFPLTGFTIYSKEVTIFFNVLLCISLLTIFVYAKPKKNSEKLLLSTLFIMLAAGLAYFNSLTRPPLSLIAMPSRYAYYFTPAIILAGIYASVRFISALNKTTKFFGRPKKYSVFGVSFWPNIGVIHLAGFLLAFFIVDNIMMMNKRLNLSTPKSLTTTAPSFKLAESISKWYKDSRHDGNISINLSGAMEDSVSDMLPGAAPVDSKFSPLIFNAQAYLTQMLGRDIKLRPVLGFADIRLCDYMACNNSKLIPSFLGQWQSLRGKVNILDGDYDNVIVAGEYLPISLLVSSDFHAVGVLSSDQQQITWAAGDVWLRRKKSDLNKEANSNSNSVSELISGHGLDRLKLMQQLQRPDENRTGITKKPIPSFLGQWRSSRGNVTILDGDYDNVIFANEHTAIFVLVSSDFHVVGVLSSDQQQITWATGEVWLRHMESDLDGDWLCNNKPVKIEVINRHKVKLTNEFGSKTKAIITNLRLSVPGWGLEGVISPSYRKITFQNGTEWLRR